MNDFPEHETNWVTPITEYFKRDKHLLGPMVLITVQHEDGTRKVVEGYHTGNNWWLSGMSPNDYYSDPLEECVGEPIAFRELPEPYDGPIARPRLLANVIELPKSRFGFKRGAE
ncbi:hypothetical protein SAMN02744133_10887 [Thalassospira xiamenensis M-5 = DSM 17429]|uniref:Uncharacterized protein n=1 Tax=Thalassospira xiamenensis M-5 = DSM 17429 TaxID=1123366 RepID=A0AB72UJI8_9PROT|nr:hypothetical protein [Thalassospira xiamenensis]AJD54363.1 hypothetical protein TH3_21453 [Thalassospira xiamenensis M-5 = DSM 17429]SIT21562.1 hypothetical protein SAMN02744133_10887 [Thalassospira xiamenensis M-5 = DSM 17429]